MSRAAARKGEGDAEGGEQEDAREPRRMWPWGPATPAPGW